MSPGSVTADRIDKPAEYAAARIPHFWRFGIDNDRQGGNRRYRLAPEAGTYSLVGKDQDSMTIDDPLSLVLDFAELL